MLKRAFIPFLIIINLILIGGIFAQSVQQKSTHDVVKSSNNSTIQFLAEIEENEIETDTDETYQIIPAFFLRHLLHFGNSSKNKICPLLVNQLLKSISKQSLLCIYRI
jgi:hypothetical protein